MMSNINVEQAQFTGVAVGGAEPEADDGVALARLCMLDEMIGAVFGAISLWYLVSSFAAMA